MNAIPTTRLISAAAAVAVSAALLAGPAYAQVESAPLSRATVNEQTRAANMAGQLMPAGEGSPQEAQPVATNKTREQRKAETMDARHKGQLPVGGMGLYTSNMSQRTATAHSTKTRGQRKAETMDAAKQHKLMPAGEAG